MRRIKDDVSKQIFLVNKNSNEEIISPEQPLKDDDTPSQCETVIIPVENNYTSTASTNAGLLQYTHEEVNSNKNTNYDNPILTDHDKSHYLSEKLRNWVIKYHVSHNCVDELLLILISIGLKVPKTAKTFLQTPKVNSHKVSIVHPGSYIHLGVEFMLTKILAPHIFCLENKIPIKLSVNIDGLPLTSSSKSSFWPILISFANVPILLKTVVPVGIYHGKFTKPSSSHEFLNPFITEMKEIINNGLCINNILLKFEISQIVCDAPAKSFVLNVKNFNAYHGCNSCTVEGTFIKNRMAFLELNAPLRSNETFRNKLDEYYHKDVSPLEELPIDITSTVVLEYMHNICLGVVKKLIVFWTKGKKPVRLINPDEVSQELVNMKSFLPSEFNRLPRTLEEVEYWKATEFRTFLLYTGPIVLKGRLKTSLYKHFILLSSAVRILISPETCFTHNYLAKDLLKRFVCEYSSNYGEEYVGYNVHGLIHVCDFVLTHGALDLFSAFKFENYLQFIKKSSKNSKNPLEDIYNRIIEHVNAQTNITPQNFPILENELPFDHIENNSINETLYERIILKQFIVSSKKVKDSYFILDNDDLVKVNKIIHFLSGNIKLEVTKFIYSPFFVNPVSSDILKIFSVNGIIPEARLLINLNVLKYKCFTVPIDENKYISIALLHTD
ncbi:unnamed protein product [Macrosiphum euphorbiae]|uniref:DUF4806 domain-containing protein n=1 Tax=Macrosiphum euphorbiae TaxID=13131 RepID=A0AAV0XNP3_9HEMI|nr:unnamed protein product [Macrosiphum euphorbiae]